MSREIKLRIREEYRLLRELAKMDSVLLDMYVYDSDSPDVETPYGTSIANGDPAYSGRPRLMILPLDKEPDLNSDHDQFPPPDYYKLGNYWPNWRIELWHEVVHQISDMVFNKWSPQEPGRIRPDGSRSESGHGEGWYEGVKYLAAKLDMEPETLELLLNR